MHRHNYGTSCIKQSCWTRRIVRRALNWTISIWKTYWPSRRSTWPTKVNNTHGIVQDEDRLILGSLTWPGCFESVTWVVFNQYQQILSTYLQTLFANTLRFVNNRRTLIVGSSVHRNVRTNIGSQQWFRSSDTSASCTPVNNILHYQGEWFSRWSMQHPNRLLIRF